MSDDADAVADLDVSRLGAWLAEAVDPSVASVEVSRLSGGNSSGAWRLDVRCAAGDRIYVLKVPGDDGLVFDCDASREARILAEAGGLGAPVPGVLAIDRSGEVLGRPAFVMDLVDGVAVPDASPASFHGDGWFRDEPVGVQAGIWMSFVDSLAALHLIDAAALDSATYDGERGVAAFLGYWRRSLLDIAPAAVVPRQLAVLDWLAANIPDEPEAERALCMGDARMGNALIADGRVCALVDFEVAYIGMPEADIGYCLMSERFTRMLSDRPATGIPPPEETWARWSAATGRMVSDEAYWTAVGTTVLCVTATRAMDRWGFPVDSIESDSLVVPEWEALVARAAGDG